MTNRYPEIDETIGYIHQHLDKPAITFRVGSLCSL
jgi:hypothetical protein